MYRERADEAADREHQKEEADEAIPRLVRAIEAWLEKEKKDEAEEKDGETLVTVSVSPESVLEDGKSRLVYTFSRSGPTEEPLRVSFDVSGTAKFEEDKKKTDYEQKGAASFGAKSGSVAIPPGARVV